MSGLNSDLSRRQGKCFHINNNIILLLDVHRASIIMINQALLVSSLEVLICHNLSIPFTWKYLAQTGRAVDESSGRCWRALLTMRHLEPTVQLSASCSGLVATLFSAVSISSYCSLLYVPSMPAVLAKYLRPISPLVKINK